MVLHGNNPYAAGPLLRCEQTPQPFGLHSVREADLPAPFPGYALLFFAVFAFLPYVVAAAVWFCVLIACLATACVFVGRLCGRSAAAGLVLLAVAYCVSVIPYGELAPIVLAALTGGASALRRGSIGGATIGLGILALLPHIALPVYIALFLWNKPMRLPIVGLAAVLAILDVAAGGPNIALAYLVQVLPNHAASEIGFVTQYSATWLAQGLGASDRIALIAGEVSYGLAVVAGIWLAGVVSARLRDTAFLMLLPVALAVTGGSFVHYSEITLAIPAALLLFTRTTGFAKVLAAVAVVCVALPWQSVVTQPLLIVALVAGTLAICAIVVGTPAPLSLRAGLAAALFCGICLVLAWHFGPQTAPHLAKEPFDPALAEASWAKHISDQTASAGIVWWIPKLPTWLGLLLIPTAAYASGRLVHSKPIANA